MNQPPDPGAVESSGRVPPQALDAERMVLGAMMLDREAIGRGIEVLDEDCFYRRAHKRIYQVLITLYDRGEAVDVITVSNELNRNGWIEEVGGLSYLSGLISEIGTAAHVEYHARIVFEKAILRRLITAAGSIVAEAYDGRLPSGELLDKAEESIFAIADQRDKKAFTSLRQMMKGTFESIEEQARRKNPITGVETGFPDLDTCTSGFQPSDLIIIAGRPSMGKTAFCLNVAENAALKSARPVAIFSLEMSKEQLIRRLLSSQSRVSGQRLRTGFLRDSDWPALAAAANRLSAAPIYIDDSPSPTVLEMRAKARRLSAEVDLGMIIIDYLQLVRGGPGVENRQQEISQISRSLKALAKELKVPVVALSQLSRAVESRGGDKRPMLSDLRECVTGDTLVCLANGERRPIRELVGQTPDVVSMSEAGQLVIAASDKIWSVGVRPVIDINMASGRTLRATGRHRLFTMDGWKRVEELSIGSRPAVARQIPEPASPVEWPDARVALLGQLIGDGSYLSGQPLRYTTSSEENSRLVVEAVSLEFGQEVKRYVGRRTWHQLLITGNGTRWNPRGVNAWLRDLGIFNQRSWQKRIPPAAFGLSNRQIALLLQHLWATDGCIWNSPASRRGSHRVYYATNSPGLALDVTALLLRLGIQSRVRHTKKDGYRPSFSVDVSGRSQQQLFLDSVGPFGPRCDQHRKLRDALNSESTVANTNVDTVPIEVFNQVRSSMLDRGITTRQMAELRGTSYGGASHFKYSPSSDTLMSYANILEDDQLKGLATSDIFWDEIVSIVPVSEEEVFDLTVPGPASWLADGIVSHNSGAIEQDADVVMFVYRPAMYDKTDENENMAEIIVAKQRNGPTDTIHLTFLRDQTRFASMDRRHGGEPFSAPAEPEEPYPG